MKSAAFDLLFSCFAGSRQALDFFFKTERS
jgi:hypothetical protein